MLMLFDICKDINFVNSALLKFLILFKTTHLNHLYRIFLVIIFIDSTIDLTVSPLADDLIQRVVLDYSYHVINFKLLYKKIVDDEINVIWWDDGGQIKQVAGWKWR